MIMNLSRMGRFNRPLPTTRLVEQAMTSAEELVNMLLEVDSAEVPVDPMDPSEDFDESYLRKRMALVRRNRQQARRVAVAA